MDKLLVQIQYLETATQMQAELIEHLTSNNILGWFQRRRVRKMLQGKQLVRRLREDELRTHVLRLKKELAEIEKNSGGR